MGFAAKLKSALFRHIQGLSYTELDTLGTATLINRMTTDMNQVQTGVNMTLRLLLRSPFVVLGAMVMAFHRGRPDRADLPGADPLLALAVAGIMRLTMPGHRKVQGQLDRVLVHTRENLTGVRVLRAFGKQDSEQAAFDGDNQLLCRMQRRVGALSALMNPLTYVHSQRRAGGPSVERGFAGTGRHAHAGRGGGAGQLSFADSGGAGQVRKPDRDHHQIHRVCGPYCKRACHARLHAHARLPHRRRQKRGNLRAL